MSEATPNYTDEQVAILRAAEPIDWDKATEIGAEIGKSARSIVAKAKREGIEYIAKPAPVKRPRGKTKADLVAEIEAYTDVKLVGLEKAPAQALEKLIQHFAA